MERNLGKLDVKRNRSRVIGMQPPVATHIGIDNKTVVDRGTELVNHHARREEEVLVNNIGSLKLGGKLSILKKETPFKQKR